MFQQSLGQMRAAVATYASLPLSGNNKGDIRIVLDLGNAYTWVSESGSGTWVDWKKVTVSNYNDLTGKPNSSPLAIDIATQAIRNIYLNYVYLFFISIVTISQNVMKMFEGMLDSFITEDGLDLTRTSGQRRLDAVGSMANVAYYRNNFDGSLDEYTKLLIHGRNYNDELQELPEGEGGGGGGGGMGGGEITYASFFDELYNDILPYNTDVDTTNDNPNFISFQEVESSTVRRWNCLATSGNGQYILAGSTASHVGDRLYLSVDYGENFYEIQPAGENTLKWDSLAISYDGSVMYAISEKDGFYTYFKSINYGTTWTPINPSGIITGNGGGAYGYSVSCSYDGSIVLIGEDTEGLYWGRLYLSKDTGETWEEVRPKGDIIDNWLGTAMSSDGSILLAVECNRGIYPCPNTGRLWLSKNCGETWSEIRPVGDNPFDSGWKPAMSADGSIILVGQEPYGASGRLYLSKDTGETWEEVRPKGDTNGSWHQLAMTANGEILYACDLNGRVWVSYNLGKSWVDEQVKGDVDCTWRCVACTPTGNISIVGEDGGKLYIKKTPSESNGNKSIIFHGGLDSYLIIPYVNQDGNPFTVNGLDFTWDFWFCPDTDDAETIIVDNSFDRPIGGAFKIEKLINKKIKVSIVGCSEYYYDMKWYPVDPVSYDVTSVNTVEKEVWSHIALVRSAGSLKLFINGNLEATSSVADNQDICYYKNSMYVPYYEGSCSFRIGYGFTGRMEEIRFSKGIARWTESFSTRTTRYNTPTQTVPCNNMVIQSNGYEADSIPTSARIVIFEQDAVLSYEPEVVETITPNTDIKVYISRDGGTTFTQATDLKYEFNIYQEVVWGSIYNNVNFLVGTVDLHLQPNGKEVCFKITTHNNKDLLIRAVGLNWK